MADTRDLATMTVDDALAIITAPFAEYDAWNAARDTILNTRATRNQRALYEQLPPVYQGQYLEALTEIHF